LFGRNLNPAPRPRRRFALRVAALEDRLVPSTLFVGSTRPFHTVQAAVNAAANSGDTISIDTGTYQEQVTIPSRFTSLTVTSTTTSSPATIKAPASVTGSGAIVDINGAKGVTLKSLTITGDGSSTVQDGILVENGGSATIQNDKVQNIKPTVGYDGVGIRVGRSALAGTPTTGTATVSNSTVTNFRDDGIDITNTGSSATVSGNTVVGGSTAASGTQNGIEISFGATGTVYGNTVTNHAFKKNNFGSTGILLYKAGSGVTVGLTNNGNTVTNNDFGIAVVDGLNPTIQYNTVTGSGDYGIGFDSSDGVAQTVGARVQFNSCSSSAAATGGNLPPDGFFFFNLTGTTSAPINITNNSGNGNTGNGFNFDMSGAAGTITFTHNNANGNVGDGIFFHDLSVNLSTTTFGPLTITNNNANGNTGNGIDVQNVTFTGSSPTSVPVTISMNNSNGNSGNGVFVLNSTGITLDGGGSSQANGNAGNGFLVQNSNFVTVKNYIAQKNAKNGFGFENSGNLTVSGDTAGGSNNNGNGQNGFTFVNVDNSSITGDTASYNQWNGILLDANSTGNSLTGNSLTNNDKANQAGFFDANDQSGTPTTVANTWSGNTIGTKNKSVIH
jgi:parallel beta-helix repeat protein